MPLCPNQHQSRTTDFCEVCGVEMTPAEADAPPVAPVSGGAGREICPACHAEHDARAGDFCEVCGYNFKTGLAPVTAPPSATTGKEMPGLAPASLLPAWELVVAVVPNPAIGIHDDVPPPRLAERVHPLAAGPLLIGRRSVRRQIDPEIPLDHDDGVSHRHARLTRWPDGACSLEDLGSSNGTTVNGVEARPGVTVPLKEGDRIALGRWTSLTLRRQASPADEVVPPPSAS